MHVRFERRLVSSSPTLTRRAFVERTLGGTAALLAACRSSLAPVANSLDAATLSVRRTSPTETVRPGFYSLALDRPRDGFLYVPQSYVPERPAPLLVLLHGAGQDSTEWSLGGIERLVDSPEVIVMGPDSRGVTWDLLDRGGYGPDVKFMDAALTRVFRYCNVDPTRIALGGFSDGATYALSLGLPNGELFSHLMAFSPGGLNVVGRHGSPRVFVAHGTSDTILPIATTRGQIVPALKASGYDVTYEEFPGDHVIDMSVAMDAIDWFIHPVA